MCLKESRNLGLENITGLNFYQRVSTRINYNILWLNAHKQICNLYHDEVQFSTIQQAKWPTIINHLYLIPSIEFEIIKWKPQTMEQCLSILPIFRGLPNTNLHSVYIDLLFCMCHVNAVTGIVVICYSPLEAIPSHCLLPIGSGKHSSTFCLFGFVHLGCVL